MRVGLFLKSEKLAKVTMTGHVPFDLTYFSFGVHSESVRGPFGVRTGSVRAPFGSVQGPFGLRSGSV